MRMLGLSLAILAVLAACEPAPATSGVSVEGVALAGPTCPVVTDPPDPSCADRPVAGAEIIAIAEDGTEVARGRTDAEGRIELLLPEGTYELVPQPVEGLMGTASPVTVRVEEGVAVDEVTFAYDTGIR